MVAVQACEAAAASVSRPSSPLDSAPPPIPLRELQTRARLEDLIDQVTLSSIRLLSRKFVSVSRWPAQQSGIVTECLA